MKNNIKRSLTEALELPGEVLLNLPLITLSGRSELEIENYKSILSYGDTEISVNTTAGILFIDGNGLELKSVTTESIAVKGNITGICYKDY